MGRWFPNEETSLVALPAQIWDIVVSELKGKMGDGHGDVDVLDTMIASLAELLEEKGYITQDKWEQKIKKNLKG